MPMAENRAGISPHCPKESIATCQYLFVYGTLRQHSDNEMSKILQQNANYIDEATFQGRLFRVDDYPGAVPSQSPADLVKGEVYRLAQPDLLLPQLDRYEECAIDFPQPTEFARKIYQVRLIGGDIIQAWVYLYNRTTDGLELLLSGDFLNA